MQGSMGDLKADFLYEIQNAMTGRTGAAAGSISKKVTKKVTKNDWAAVVEHSTRLCVLWPSRNCAGSKMSVSSFLNLRSMPAKHWKEKISEKAKDFCFFDGVVIRSCKLISMRSYLATAPRWKRQKVRSDVFF